MQVLASFHANYDIPWPDSMLDWLNAADYVNVPALYLPGLSCLWPRVGVYRGLVAYFIAPLAMVAFCGAVFAAALALVRR